MSATNWKWHGEFKRRMKAAREAKLPVHPTALEEHRATLANIDAYVTDLRGRYEELREALEYAGIDADTLVTRLRESRPKAN